MHFCLNETNKFLTLIEKKINIGESFGEFFILSEISNETENKKRGSNEKN